MLIPDFRIWSQNTDFYFSRFVLLATKLTEFILDYCLNEKNFTKEVASKLIYVMNRCDEIDYQEDSTATAYGILHFLPRFHRFQLIFSKLIDKNLLPLNKKNIDVLDIGTGPGPSLFAISDVYLSINEYGKEKRENVLSNLTFKTDYVERSSGFRNWLHHFTEVANNKLPENIIGWNIPFHFGTFNDFTNIQFNENINHWDYDYENDFIQQTKKIKHRFNIIIFSNFLTRLNQVDQFKIELQNCMRFLRNNGKLIISGGTGKIDTNKNYPEIYKKVRDVLLENVYGNYRFYAKGKYVNIRRNKLSFFYNDRFGEVIKKFNEKVIKRFIDHDAIKEIDPKIRCKYLNTIKKDYNYESKWEFHTFEKYARLKYKWYKKHKQNPSYNLM